MKKRKWKRSGRDRQADAHSFPFHSSYSSTSPHKKEEAKPSITSTSAPPRTPGQHPPGSGCTGHSWPFVRPRRSARRPAGRSRDGGVSNPPEQGNDSGGGVGDCGGANGGSARRLGRVRASFVLADAADCERSRRVQTLARASMMLKRRTTATATTPKLPRPL